jgi:hypothetical protein
MAAGRDQGLGEQIQDAVVDGAVNKAKEEAQKNVGQAFMSTVQETAKKGDPITVGAMVLLGGIVVGVAYGSLRWYQYKARRYLEDVEFVEANHKEFLQNIKVRKSHDSFTDFL